METSYQGCDAEAMKRNLMKTKIILQLTVNISESLRANYIASRGVAQRCEILRASSWSLIRVVTGTMWGGIFMAALRPHSDSLGVIG